MKIIEPSFQIVNPKDQIEGIEMLRKIEAMARISHRSEEKQTEDSWQRFIKAVVLEHGDWSVVEHASATVIFRTDRGITHELVRHRVSSFTQESTRFVSGRKSYPEGLEFIRPQNLPEGEAYWHFEQSVSLAEQAYLSMLDLGVRPQEARSVLPNCLASTIAVTANLRNWRYIFLARVTKEAHPDMKRIMVPVLQQFRERIPIIFDDIVVEARQIHNLEKAR